MTEPFTPEDYARMTPEEAAIMEKKQETVLKNLKINREVTT